MGWALIQGLRDRREGSEIDAAALNGRHDRLMLLLVESHASRAAIRRTLAALRVPVLCGGVATIAMPCRLAGAAGSRQCSRHW